LPQIVRASDVYVLLSRMPKSVVVTSALVLTLLATAGNPIFSRRWSHVYAKPQSALPAYAPGEIIVKLKDSTGPVATDTVRLEAVDRAAVDLASRAGAIGAEPLFQRAWNERLGPVARSHGLDSFFLLRVDPNQDLGSLIEKLKADESVEVAEPNYLVKPGLMIPNDPGFFQQWPLLNFGFAVDGQPTTQGADIHAADAWTITTGDPNVIVAVTDTGVDITHPDLAANIYTNPGVVHDGYPGDLHGYDVADNSADVTDVLGHGTEMSGIIGAVLNNNLGVSGMCQSKVLPVRFFKKTGPGPSDIQGSVADAAKAIVYSMVAGASIINASWTITVPDSDLPALKAAVQATSDAGVLLVCIAGNEGINNDTNVIYPNAYQLPNQIVVAASDYNDELWHAPGLPQMINSGYGPATVQLCAPGVSVYTLQARGPCFLCTTSTNPSDWYGAVTGTSAAAAFVSGVAALVKSKYPQDTGPVMRRRILESVDSKVALQGRVVTGGRLSALGALTIQLKITPPVVAKVKYKAGAQKLMILGSDMQQGATILVGSTGYPTSPKGDLSTLIAHVPDTAFPPGVTVTLVLRNPDGGTSQPITITR
jgi:subtilisin family serine protease